MELSHHITNMLVGGSDGWEVFERSRRMIAQGIDITELTIGEHDIRTDPVILEAMHKSAMGGHTGYASVPGTPALRQAVAARVQARTGTPTSVENVMVTPGGQSALYSAHVATLNPGDRALYIDPYYATYPGTLRGVGATAVPIRTAPEHGFQPQAADLRAAAPGAKSLLINSPNNPTGAVYGVQTLNAIADICRDHGIWLISDEVYDTQVWNGTHISPRSLPGMAEQTLVIGSMSKSHAMTGSRVGWIVGPKEVIGHLINLATNTTYGVPGFVQDAARFALEQGGALEEKVAAPFRRRREIAAKLLAGQNLVSAVPSDGAMYIMLDIRKTGLSGQDFANQLLDQEHIAVMPGESFGNSAAGHLRVAMTVADEAFQDAIERLLRFAHHLAGAEHAQAES